MAVAEGGGESGAHRGAAALGGIEPAAVADGVEAAGLGTGRLLSRTGLMVVVLALLFEALYPRRLKPAGVTEATARVALHEMKRLRVLEDQVAGVRLRRTSRVDAAQRRVLQALGIDPPGSLVIATPEKRRKPQFGNRLRRS